MTSGKKAKRMRSAQPTPSPTATSVVKKVSRLPLLIAFALVMLLVVVIGVVLWTQREDDGTPPGAPRGAIAENKGVRVNSAPVKPGTPVLDIYEDFLCPHCADEHLKFGETIKTWAKDGTFDVVYHMKAFMGRESLLAANASACAADIGTDKFLNVHNLLMQRQKVLAELGMKEESLQALGPEIGLQGDPLKLYEVCIRKHRFNKYVEKVEKKSGEDKVTSTPTYRVNGVTVDNKNIPDAAEFTKRVFAAAKMPIPTPAAKATGSPAGSASVTAPGTSTPPAAPAVTSAP